MAGRSATSGAINQVTKTPQARDAQDYSLGYGSDDYKRVTADVNLGLSDSMALRVNAMYHDAEVSNRDVVENKRRGIAPSLALGLGDSDARHAELSLSRRRQRSGLRPALGHDHADDRC